MIVSSNQGTSCVFAKKEKSIKPFGLLIELILKESKISVTNIHETTISKTPSQIIKKT